MRALTILTAFVALGTGFVVLDRLTAPARGTASRRVAADPVANDTGIGGSLFSWRTADSPRRSRNLGTERSCSGRAAARGTALARHA